MRPPTQGLAAGGSRSPADLEKIVGVGAADPGFWESCLGLVEEAPEAAAEEDLAAADDAA